MPVVQFQVTRLWDIAPLWMPMGINYQAESFQELNNGREETI